MATGPMVGRALMAIAVAITVGGCAGAPAAPSDPPAAVAAALGALDGQPIAGIAEYSCPARHDEAIVELAGANFSNLGALAARIDGARLLAAMRIRFQGVRIEQVSTTGANATVHVTADVTVIVDEQALRSILSAMAKEQDLVVDDIQLDDAVSRMVTQLAQPQRLDRMLDLTKDADRWLLCPGGGT